MLNTSTRPINAAVGGGSVMPDDHPIKSHRKTPHEMSLTPRQVVRFWSLVQRSDGCWRWTGNTLRGYGRFGCNRRKYLAHRVSWVLVKGRIDPELIIDHLCRNPICVNPEHLEPVTLATNTSRGNSPTTWNAKKTHCPLGHELSPETWRRGKSWRICRICARDRTRAAMARMRGAKGTPTVT